MKNIHVGLNGKGERFDLYSTKPTREKLIEAELGGGIGAIKSLRDLENRSSKVHELKQKAREIMQAEDDEKEAIEREIDTLNAQLAEVEQKSTRPLSLPDKPEIRRRIEELTRQRKSDRDRELEIALTAWMKEKRSYESNLLRLFGVITGNMSPTSREVVDRLPISDMLEREQDGWLLFVAVIHSHSVVSVHHVQLSKTTAEKEYNGYKMEGSMEIIHFKKGYEHVLKGLESAGCEVPSDETQARHFLDKLDLRRYSGLVLFLHNKVFTYPDTLEKAYQLCLDHVSAVVKTGQPKEGGMDAFTSYPVESDSGKGKPRKGKKKKTSDKKAEKVDEKKDQKADASKSQPKKPQEVKDERSCFGCSKRGHLLKDCPMREKVIAQYSKKGAEGNAMTALGEEEQMNIFWGYPVLTEDGNEPDSTDSAGMEAFVEDFNSDAIDWDSYTPKELDSETVKANPVCAISTGVKAGPICVVTVFLSLLTTIWQYMQEVWQCIQDAASDTLCCANCAITRNSLLLDTGSDIHLAASENIPGLSNVVVADPPYKVKGVGYGTVSLHKVGSFIDVGPMYIGKCPCTIISVGLACDHGAKVTWADDMSTATLTTKSGIKLVFKRRRKVWVCNDYDAEVLSVSMPTEAEVMLKYNRHELKEAEEAAEYLKRMRYPGRGTARSIVNTGAIRNLPVTTKGLNTRFNISGQELASEKGGRKKHSPKLSPDIVNESIQTEQRSSVLYVDLFFLNSLPFLLGAFYVPYSERAVYLQQFLSKGKGIDSILGGITSFVGIMRSNRVHCDGIACDLESAVGGAKPKIEAGLKVPVKQIGDNVAEIERGVQTVKMVCRKVKAGLPFNLYGILFVFLVAWAVSGINMWTSPNFMGKLSPKEALTGRKPDADKELNASFGDYLRTDSTNAAFSNDLSERAVEALALAPLGNARGEWYCLSLDTFRVLTRTIRPGDIVPTPTRVVHLLNNRAVKWSQDLKFLTSRGVVAEMQDDVDILQQTPVYVEDRSGVVVDNANENVSSIGDMTDAPAYIMPDVESAGVISNPGVSSGLGQPNAGVNAGVQPELQFASQPLSDPVNSAVSTEMQSEETVVIDMQSEEETAVIDENSKVSNDANNSKSAAAVAGERELRRSNRSTATSWQERGNWKLTEGTKSKLPYNSNLREQPVRGKAKKASPIKGSLYVSARKDDVGKAYAFHMSLMKGLRKHRQAGFEAMLKELMLVHETGTIEGIDYAKLSPAQKSRAIRSLLFFKEKYKPDGTFDKLKARLVAGGHMQDRSVYSESDTSAPTVATEAVMMIAVIAAREQRHVVTVDIGGAFLKGKFREDSTPVYMRLDKDLADTLCAIDKGYEALLRPDGSLYVKLTRPLYGLIEAAKLWHDEISSTLKKLGFEKNAYDQCTYNRVYEGHQHTVIIHVDDLMSTCCDDRANQQLIAALQEKYKEINVEQGSVHSYLGMTFDFSTKSKVKITQDGYVAELVASEDIKSAVKTPATEDLFVIDESSPELCASAKEHFHSLTAKLLYLSKRTRPDILVAVSFLTSRVLIATEQDGVKLTRVLRYLYGTQELGVTLEADEQVYKLYCYIDASFGVHADAKSHTGSVVTMGKGPIVAKSVKQKINTKSSTEAELVGLSDGLSLVIWARNFLEAQGYHMPPATVFQDNMSTIAMLKNGRPTSDRTRHINIRFFFASDKQTGGEIEIEYKPTKEMLADILTKPLQGELFQQLRNELLNCSA